MESLFNYHEQQLEVGTVYTPYALNSDSNEIHTVKWRKNILLTADNS